MLPLVAALATSYCAPPLLGARRAVVADSRALVPLAVVDQAPPADNLVMEAVNNNNRADRQQSKSSSFGNRKMAGRSSKKGSN